MRDAISDLLPQHYAGIEDLQKEFARYQKAGFPERGANFFALELNGEAGELANLEKKVWKGKEIPLDQFEDQAADVLIALLNYANARGVNLAKATEKKMAVIDTKRIDGTH